MSAACQLTHAELVKRAARWLRSSAIIPAHQSGKRRKVQCRVVLTELVTSTLEKPDAIGWAYGGITSILVECKCSRSDFAADQKKSFRRYEGAGMGRYRYYMTRPGLLKESELPTGWGLLEVDGRQVRVVRLSDEHARNTNCEMTLLWSACRRFQNAPQPESDHAE